MSWFRAAQRVIDKYGVSMTEFYILMDVGVRIPLRADEFARYVANAYHAGPPCTATECEDAIDSCVRKGWVRILTHADIDDVSDVGTMHSFPDLSYNCYQEGSVDFTPTGYQLFRRMGRELSEALDEQRLRKYDVVRVVRLGQQSRRFHGNCPATVDPSLGDVASIVHIHDEHDPNSDVVLEMLDADDGSVLWLADFWQSEVEFVDRPSRNE